MSDDSGGEFTACGMCANCAVTLPAGFASRYERHCTRFDIPVDSLDGCTFGTPGEPIWGTRYPRTELGPYAAVQGTSYYD